MATIIEVKDHQREETFKHYLVAALWSSTDDEGEPLDAEYDIEDIDADTLVALQEDVNKFLDTVATNGMLAQLMEADYTSPEATFYECVGHDLWLTRCGHGVGFWDRGVGEIGQEITDLINEQHKNIELYVGDDGKIYK